MAGLMLECDICERRVQVGELGICFAVGSPQDPDAVAMLCSKCHENFHEACRDLAGFDAARCDPEKPEQA